MLENEGFVWEKYVDIFDGGPTMTARTDSIRTVREAEDSVILDVSDALGEQRGGDKVLASFGRLGDFRCAFGWVERGEGGVALDRQCAALLGAGEGDTVTHIARW
jgi:arginine N-succinyltransferase